jgi:dodecin
MSDSVYKVIEVIGTSSKSWEAAAAAAVERASQSLRDLRVAEVTEQDRFLLWLLNPKRLLEIPNLTTHLRGTPILMVRLSAFARSAAMIFAVQ